MYLEENLMNDEGPLGVLPLKRSSLKQVRFSSTCAHTSKRYVRQYMYCIDGFELPVRVVRLDS